MDLLNGLNLVKRLGDQNVLNRVSIDISQGSAVAIAGATGSGKSTLLKILAGLIDSDSGSVLFQGKNLEGPSTKLIAGHEKIGYLSQYFELRNNYRVEEIFDYSNKIDEAKTTEIIALCQVSHLLKRRTDQLSGGERQRVALARIIITGPEILLLDEPFSNLDLTQKTSVKNALAAVINAFHLTTVLVSHDPIDLLPFADIIHVMQDGQIIQSGRSREIYYRPLNEYVAGLFGPYTLVDKTLQSLLHIQDGIHFLRPEMLSIVPEENGAANGRVISVAFMGAFWQAHVVINGYMLTCNYNNLSIQKGSRVSISLLQD